MLTPPIMIEAMQLSSKVTPEKAPISEIISQLISGDKVRKENAASTLMHLSGLHDENVVCIAKEGGIPPLVSLLSGREDCSDNCVKYASTALTNLSALQENRIIMVREGIIPHILRMLNRNNDKFKERAAVILGNLAAERENCELIANVGCISPLVSLLIYGSDNGKKESSGTLWNLSKGSLEIKSRIADEGAIPPLVELMRTGSSGSRLYASGTIASLANNSNNCLLIPEAGGVSALIEMLTAKEEGKHGDLLHENAALALRNLAVRAENKTEIVKQGGVPPLVALLSDSSDSCKKQAAGALSNLAVNSKNKRIIAAYGAIPPLVSIISVGQEKCVDRALSALRQLSRNSDNKLTIARNGCIPLLVGLLSSDIVNFREKTAEILSSLANDLEDTYSTGNFIWHTLLEVPNKVIIARSGGVKPLIDLLTDSSEVVKQHATCALCSLATVEENRVLIAQEGGIIPLVNLLDAANDYTKANAVGCLGNLAREHDDYSQIISKAGGLSLLIALVDKGSDDIKDKAAGALWNLSFCEENREAIISAGKAVIEAASDAVRSSDRLQCLKSLVCRVTMHHKDKYYF